MEKIQDDKKEGNRKMIKGRQRYNMKRQREKIWKWGNTKGMKRKKRIVYVNRREIKER